VKPHDAKEGFEKRLAAPLKELLPRDGIQSFLDFYVHSRATGCKIEDKGDMLLFQWGTYDWGAGEFFELDITRQFIESDVEDAEVLQLHLTFQFSPRAALKKVGDGNQWCSSPKDVRAFGQFIMKSAALAAVTGLTPKKVSLVLEDAC
jgi:hypothetical protein